MTLSKNKVYLNVPFERKDVAKAVYQCRWDQDMKSWYCMKSNQEAINEFGNSNLVEEQEEPLNTVDEPTRKSTTSYKWTRYEKREVYINQYIMNLRKEMFQAKQKRDKHKMGTEYYIYFDYDYWRCYYMAEWILLHKTYLIQKRTYDDDISTIWNENKLYTSYSRRDFADGHKFTQAMYNTLVKIADFRRSQLALRQENERIDNLMV